ncbi:MAG: hypothetical protein NVSMB26_00620 [Beijerinckiaceae bacterium]
MDRADRFDRRALGRALSKIANASVAEALAAAASGVAGARRIGITGPPGAGKSSLISRLARQRLSGDRRLGIVAIDPTSPYSHGAILGDRIRMEHVAEDPRIFIRSLASRGAQDGLADNIADVLAVMDGYPFDEVILETVGVGQAEHSIRTLVDTLVLVLVPESGDQIQAMKAGMLETADIYVVNKGDLPGAEKSASELRAVSKLSRGSRTGWDVPIVITGLRDESGIAALDAAVTEHLDWLSTNVDPVRVARQRKAYHLRSLIQRSVGEILSEDAGLQDGRGLRDLFAIVSERLKERTRF